MKQRKLGPTQLNVLVELLHFREWTGNGWHYSTKAETRRILDALWDRGLVALVGNTYLPLAESIHTYLMYNPNMRLMDHLRLYRKAGGTNEQERESKQCGGASTD